MMASFSAEEEVSLQSMVRQLLQSAKEKLASAPSAECAEEILLHLEETDEHFHNYELVKYLRHYIKSSLGSVIDDETERCTLAQTQGDGSGYDTLVQRVTKRTRESKDYTEMILSLKNVMMAVVETLLNKFEEDQAKNREMQRKALHEQHNSRYTDNCSDSDSSFNQSYTFMNQEQLQLIAEHLDPSQPEEVRKEAMQTLCSAPPSDVLNCESWSVLHKNLTLALADPDSTFTERILRFYAKTFSSSPLNMAREVYTSLVKHLESSFILSHKPILLTGVDINNPEVVRTLKKIRLLNDYQKEVPSFWIRHPEKYMEEIIESTLSLLSVTQESSSQILLDPVLYLSMIDTKAVWFKKWMHAYYSRTVVLRLLEKKYKSLIIAAIEQCFYYYESSQSGADENTKTAPSQPYPGIKQKTLYARKELQYLYFVHSLNVLGRLLIYKHGRKLFPIKLKNRKESVSLSDLVVLFTHIMLYCPNGQKRAVGTYAGNYAPAHLAMEVLKMLCDRKECAGECLYTEAVIESLLFPIQKLLKGKKVHQNCDECTLTFIADIMARIASNGAGLSLLLYGENKDSTNDSTAGAHVIAQFSKKLLSDDITTLTESDLLPVLKGSFLFVCRQMYQTCEGLQILVPYQLHACIAEAWKKTVLISERTPTPVAGAASLSSGSQDSQGAMLWEESLLDSLLNLASTPRGLLLLQQTGAINECIHYMFGRFTKKLQVNRSEKFGYGVLVTQVAATAPGAVALQKSGFIQTFVSGLWAALECGRDDVRVIHPKPTPVDPIDRSCQKSFLALINLLSSYHAVYELLGNQHLPSRDEYSLREVPISFVDVFDRLVVVNSVAKINSLFNYDQSHIFGLRVLNVLCCNLDTLLLLESQYKVCEMLFNAQRENVTDSSTGSQNIIVDGLSVERNHILVRMNVIGGPHERVLPSRVMLQGNDPYPWPMFSSYPLPKCYVPEVTTTNNPTQDHELLKFLSSGGTDQKVTWLDNCKRLFCKTMKTKPGVLRGLLYGELLEKYISYMYDIPSNCIFERFEYKDTHMPSESLSLSQQLGVKIVIRYGRHLGLLSGNKVQDLTWLLQQCEGFLQQQQVSVSSPLQYIQGSYPGHDWFASSMFLIMSGDAEKTLTILQKFSSLLTSAYLWLPRLHISKHLPLDIRASGIHPIFFCTAHYIEMLMKTEVPLVFSAFRMSGFTPSQICQHWLSQCFWNYLDWGEICHYLGVCILLGADYQVYMCIAVFKHLQQEILQHTQTQDLQVFLKEEAIHGFKVSDYLEFMEGLEHVYRPMVLKEMKNAAHN
ncbi:protein broad-minded [Hyla sarda]|uniref:protein broad-minded n=1 Tax=Hyla sarda TaxID=327740 RepID=UPI0024C2F92C|nr:protein broad-minded [Hyla sarda]XP_056413063.1 protein broad-minded [Hyla sarda]XP_056413064.1 protein broad-minded [Hyla sarda]